MLITKIFPKSEFLWKLRSSTLFFRRKVRIDKISLLNARNRLTERTNAGKIVITKKEGNP